jgi:hypothetical protein
VKPRGTCKLCLQKRDLCDSHYLPTALFALCQDGNYAPIVMTEELILSINRQVKAYLLCFDCEQRFSRLGETDSMKLVYRDSGFGLMDAFSSAKRFRPEPEGTAYFGKELSVDIDALAYFALSAVWRGSVHDWRTLTTQTTGISLGAFEEPIRKYLNGEAGFPADVFVWVIAAADEGSQESVCFPSQVKDLPYTRFSFLTRGIWFDVSLGSDLPFGVRRRCCVNSPKKLLFKADCTYRISTGGGRLQGMAKIARNVRPS